MGTLLEAFQSRMEREGIYELFDSLPIQTEFTFEDRGDDLITNPILDGKGNVLRVLFHKGRNDIFMLDFIINGSSFENPDIEYSVKEYSTLVATVSQVVNQFLKEYTPYGVMLGGVDSMTKVEKRAAFKGQKNRIYAYFLMQLKGNMDYYTIKEKGDLGMSLVRRK